MPNQHDHQYLAQLAAIMAHGVDRQDRTGVGTRGLFGLQGRYNLEDGFPLLTTKKVHTTSVFAELLWFLAGDTNVKTLQEQGVGIWDEWADEDGELGPVYGHQWRHWGADVDLAFYKGVDQITNVIYDLEHNPFSRRHIVSAWNPEDLPAMALPPCHTMFQFYVHPDENGEPESLSCQLYQRSADMFLGVPFNIASYALLTEMVAAQTGLKAKEFIHTIGDGHIYLNHFEQVNEQMHRVPFVPPTLELKPRNSIFEYTLEDITIHNYDHHPAIKAPVAI
jgi:thymidylate synthase